MKKVFTLLFVAMIGLCSWADDYVTFDFDNNYHQLFPTLPGVSSNTSHDGDFTEATTTVLEGVSLTVSAGLEGEPANCIWDTFPRLRMCSGTFSITAPEGKVITNVFIPPTRTSWYGENMPNWGTLTFYMDTSGNMDLRWKGITDSLAITIRGETRLGIIVVTLSEGVNNISSMKTDALKSNAIYNLQGQRMMATKKGLYIINGKKVVK
jgi:hypothetical protein